MQIRKPQQLRESVFCLQTCYFRKLWGLGWSWWDYFSYQQQVLLLQNMIICGWTVLSSTGFILNRGKGLRQVCTECVSFPFCNLPAFWRIPIEYHELSWCRYLEKSIHCRENKNVTPAQWLQCVRRKRKFLYQRLNKSCFELQVISALPLWNITIGHGWK